MSMRHSFESLCVVEPYNHKSDSSNKMLLIWHSLDVGLCESTFTSQHSILVRIELLFYVSSEHFEN